MSRRLLQIIAICAVVLVGGAASADPPKADLELEIRSDADDNAPLRVELDAERTRGVMRIGVGSDVWTSPVYPMFDADTADLDGDGRDEVILGIWSQKKRHGENPPRRTVWVMRWTGDDLRPLWRGSTLARPLVDYVVGDISGDASAELVAMERIEEQCMLSAYAWNGFGFGAMDARQISCDTKLDGSTAGCLLIDSGRRCFQLTDGAFDEAR